MKQRLTARDKSGNAYYIKCIDGPCQGAGCLNNECEHMDEICEQLATYEDTEDERQMQPCEDAQ